MSSLTVERLDGSMDRRLNEYDSPPILKGRPVREFVQRRLFMSG